MLIHSAFPFKSVISALLILSLIAPSLLVPPVAFASLGGGADGSGGFGEGEGPDGGGSGPSGDDGGNGGGYSGNGGDDAPSEGAGGPGVGPEGQAAQAAAAAEGVADNAASKGVDGLSVDAVSPDTVSVNGQEMSVDAANQAVSAMAAANAAGLAPATGPNAPGYNVDATLSAHANGTAPANGVVGNMTGVTGVPDTVAHAEIDAAIGSKAATAAPSTSMAPTNSIQGILSAAAAHPALMDQTPISLQSHTFSPVAVSMTTAVSQPTVTPNQSFSTANQTIDATSFSLGSFAPGLSANPTAPDPNEGRMGLATGRMAQISMTMQMELDKVTKAMMQTPPTAPVPTALQAQALALESKIAALDARAVAMVSPTVTNQAVASLAQQKSVELSAIATDVASKQAMNQTTLALDALSHMNDRADTYDSRMSAAQADAKTAQNELSYAATLAKTDVDVALGKAPAAPAFSAGPQSSLAGLGISLGLSPPAANAVASFANAVKDAVISSLPGLATLSAVADYADAKTMADVFSAQAQAEVDEAVGLGIADSFGFSPNSQTSVSVDATEPIGLGIADSFGFAPAGVSTISTEPSTAAQNAASMQAQATALGFQAIGIAMMDVMGLSFSLGISGKTASAPAAATGKATSAAAPSTASVAATNATTPTTAPTISFSPTAKAAANTVEGRFSPVASVADNAVSPTAGKTAAASSLGKAADDVASPTVAANDNVSAAGKTGMTGTAGQLGKAADDAVSPTGNTPGMTGTAGNLGKAADDAVGPTGNSTGMTGTAGQLGKAADDVASPSSPTAANDNTVAPSVPGVTKADSLVGPAAPSKASATKSMAVALAMTQALATPAALGRATIDAMQSVVAAISRTADDVSPTAPTGISVRSADDVAQTAPAAPTASTQSQAAPTASTQAPAATTPTIGLAAPAVPSATTPTAQTPTTPSVTSVPSQTAPAATTPAAQSPTAQAPTPAAPTAAAPTAQAPATAPTQATNPAQTAPAATTPAAQSPTAQATTPAAPTAAAPTAQAPAASRSPVSEAVSSAVRGIANAFNQLFGVTPAASKPASPVNIVNLEKTPATQDFLGVVPDDSRFLSFEDNTTAVRALLRDLENKIKDLEAAKTPATLNNVIPKYSPATENNPTRHANTIAGEVAKDIPGFTADTPISLADLKGPTGAALAKGFAQAEEGISLPSEDATKGVAAYAALPSVPTTLKNGVYAPTNPADQVTLDNIRNGSPTAVADAAPAAAPSVPQAIENVAKTLVDAAQYSPTVVAVKATAGLVDQLRNPTPAANNPAPSQAVTAQAQPAAPSQNVITKDSTPAQVQQFWASRNPGKANLAKVNPTLLKAKAMGIQAFEAQNPQYKVALQGPASGFRSGGSVANHGTQRDGYGGALDVVITDTTTNSRLTNHPLLKYRGPVDLAKAAPIYQKLFNATVIAGYHIDPAFAQTLRFGGYFASSNAMDAMHTDVRSHMPHGGGTTLGGFTPAQMKAHDITQNNPLGSWANVKTLADARYKNATGIELADVPVPMPAPRSGTTVAEPTTPAAPTPAVSTPPAQTVEDTNVPIPVSAPRSGTTVAEPTTPAAPTPAVSTPPTTPAKAEPTSPTQPTAPTVTTVVPITVVQNPASPATNATVAPTPSTPSQPASQTPTPNVVSPTTPGATTDSTSPDAPTTPGSNVGTPPDNLGTVGAGTAATPASTNPVVRAGYAAYTAIAGLLAAIANLFGDDGPESEDGSQDPNATVPSNAPTTPGTSGTDTNVPGATPPSSPTDVPSVPGVTPSNPSNLDPIYYDQTSSASTTERDTIHVLIQVDGNTGDLYFDVAGVVYEGEYYDLAEDDEDAENEEGLDEPRIVLDDQRLNVIFSDGTYAPPTINGVSYEIPGGPQYVYTLEYYQDGKLVSIAENVEVIPKGNPVSNILNALFTDDDSYTVNDVSAVTRALVDPDSEVPADEYYVYQVYLKDGDVRGTTIPRYTSHRFMSERFAETGFTGSVLALVGASVEIPPPSTGRLASGIINTLKSVGLTALDLFRGSEEGNPIMTDLGRLTPSDDGVINMNDIKSVIVLLDVEAECPAIPGLTRPYLYEIVIAASAISGAGSDQAFRAVRCGGGTKEDYVEQVAGHFETFDGVGELDRARLTEMIRFAAFKDLDMSRLVAGKSEDNTATSTPATTPETPEDDEEFVPNVTNEVVFEVKATGSQGQTLLDWSALNSIQVSTGIQLHFRWNGSAYQQCLAFLNDSGDYALTVSNRAMTRGDTESEGYDVREASTTYRVECGGQRNNEFGVDDRNIQVIIE